MYKTAKLAGILLLAVGLGACETATRVKEIGYGVAADVGNTYCENRDQGTRDVLMGRINAGLRDKGAKFTVDGVTCDAPE
jgi:ribose 5-phosphate isomerase RpiB